MYGSSAIAPFGYSPTASPIFLLSLLVLLLLLYGRGPSCNEACSENATKPPATLVNALSQLKVRCASCRSIIVRKDYESHATSFKCKVTCPHGCKKKISRAEWADHEKECPDKIVPCAAAEYGCTFKVARTELKHHSCPQLAMKPYLSILLNIASLKNLNEEVATLKKELTRVSSQNDALLQENQYLRSYILSNGNGSAPPPASDFVALVALKKLVEDQVARIDVLEIRKMELSQVDKLSAPVPLAPLSPRPVPPLSPRPLPVEVADAVPARAPHPDSPVNHSQETLPLPETFPRAPPQPTTSAASASPQNKNTNGGHHNNGITRSISFPVPAQPSPAERNPLDSAPLAGKPSGRGQVNEAKAKFEAQNEKKDKEKEKEKDKKKADKDKKKFEKNDKPEKPPVDKTKKNPARMTKAFSSFGPSKKDSNAIYDVSKPVAAPSPSSPRGPSSRAAQSPPPPPMNSSPISAQPQTPPAVHQPPMSPRVSTMNPVPPPPPRHSLVQNPSSLSPRASTMNPLPPSSPPPSRLSLQTPPPPLTHPHSPEARGESHSEPLERPLSPRLPPPPLTLPAQAPMFQHVTHPTNVIYTGTPLSPHSPRQETPTHQISSFPPPPELPLPAALSPRGQSFEPAPGSLPPPPEDEGGEFFQVLDERIESSFPPASDSSIQRPTVALPPPPQLSRPNPAPEPALGAAIRARPLPTPQGPPRQAARPLPPPTNVQQAPY